MKKQTALASSIVLAFALTALLAGCGNQATPAQTTLAAANQPQDAAATAVAVVPAAAPAPADNPAQEQAPAPVKEDETAPVTIQADNAPAQVPDGNDNQTYETTHDTDGLLDEDGRPAEPGEIFRDQIDVSEVDSYGFRVDQPVRLHTNGLDLLIHLERKTGSVIEETFWFSYTAQTLSYQYLCRQEINGQMKVWTETEEKTIYSNRSKFWFPGSEFPDTYNGIPMRWKDWVFLGWSTEPIPFDPENSDYVTEYFWEGFSDEELKKLDDNAFELFFDPYSRYSWRVYTMEPIDLYAVYRPRTCVTYVIDGSGAGNYWDGHYYASLEGWNVEYEIDYAPDPAPAARTGYVFTGWATEAGRDWPEYNVGDIITVAGPVTLHTCWMTVEDYEKNFGEPEREAAMEEDFDQPDVPDEPQQPEQPAVPNEPQEPELPPAPGVE